MRFSDDGTHLTDLILPGYENVFTWDTKPDASEYVGSAWFSDIGAIGYSNGVIWKTNSTKTRPIDIIYFGDSITDKNIYDSASGQYNTSMTGYGVWAEILSAGKLNLKGSFGYPGYSSSNPLVSSRLTDVCQVLIGQECDYLFVLAGANDLDSSTATERIGFLETLWQKLEGYGFNLVVGTITPHSGWGTKGNSDTFIVNQYIIDQAQEGRFKVVDFHRAVRSSSALSVFETNSWRTNGSSDGLHPSTVGAYWMGKAIVDEFLPLTNCAFVANNQFNGYQSPKIITTNPAMFYGATPSPGGSNGLNLDTGVTGTGPWWWTVINPQNATVATLGEASNYTKYESRQFSLEVTAGAGTYYPVYIYREFDFSPIRNAARNTQGIYFGEFRLPPVSNGFIYKCISADGGTTGSSVPEFPTVEGQCFDDGTATMQTMKLPADGLIIQATTNFVITAMTGEWGFYSEFSTDGPSYNGLTRPKVLHGSTEKSPGDGNYTFKSPISDWATAADSIPSDIINKQVVLKSQKIVLRTGTSPSIGIIRQSFGVTGRSAGATMTIKIQGFELKIVN